MTFGSLFSGIGGMDLGLERAGMTCKWQVEVDPFCQNVLEKNWPKVRRFGDIRSVIGSGLDAVDLLAGGFPCQDVSVAGIRRGIKDGTRSGLWAEFTRLIGEIRPRPRFVLIENVSGLLANEPMRRVLGDLSALGMDAEWDMFPASAIGTPHERERVWIIAYSSGESRVHESFSILRSARLPHDEASWWDTHTWDETKPKVCRVDDGIPYRVVRTEKFGNAVVPQVAEWIGRRIMEAA